VIWRLWVFVAGCPVGAVAFLGCTLHAGPAPARGLSAWAAANPWLALAGCSALVGAGAVLLASWLARRGADEPERPLHLAAGASFGLAGLPAAVAAWLDLAPGPLAHAALAGAAFAAGLVFGARAQGSAGGLPRRAGLAVAGVAATSIALVALSVAVGAVAGPGTTPPRGLAAAVLEVDARTPLAPARSCRLSGPAEVLLDRGAHPAFGPDGRVLWLDAPDEAGTRQIHRLDLRTRELQCWTCGEPGHNLRPRPVPGGRALLFVTSRHRRTLAPAQWEIHSVRATGARPPPGSRRLTFHPAWDDIPVAPPLPETVVFTRRGRGRTDVLLATVRTGHGGLLLGPASVLFSGGPAFATSLGWSPDARALLLARGNPLGPLEVRTLDPATGEQRGLGDGIAWNAGAAFAPDGSLVALATTSRASALGVLPGWLGAVLAPLALGRDAFGVLFRGTGLRLAAREGPPADFDLGEAGDWGSPTGIGLAPDLGSVVLGQRREGKRGLEERIVQIPLRCGTPDAGGAGRGATGTGRDAAHR